LGALEDAGIRYLIVGGIALGLHAEPRYTKDLDVLVAVDSTNSATLFGVLKEFGAPVHLVGPEEFLAEDFIFHFGLPPWRIDILTSVPGVAFDAAYNDRIRMFLGPRQVDVISREWLIQSKKASGRIQDLADVAKLEQAE